MINAQLDTKTKLLVKTVPCVQQEHMQQLVLVLVQLVAVDNIQMMELGRYLEYTRIVGEPLFNPFL